MNTLYFDILKSTLNLLDDLNILNKPFLDNINKKIISEKEVSFGKYYDIIRFYKGQNNINKFVLSQINDYYKNFKIFGDITYYKYNKSKNLYSNINFIRYKYLEYRNGIHQENKPVLHYIFFFQFIDFLLTRGRLVLEPHKITEIGYTLFGRFLEKLQKTEYLTKFRPIYYYSSILNIDLTNNIGISKYFTDYPYSVRFLVYKLNKIIKDYGEITNVEMMEIINKEINNKENKIGGKFREGGKENQSLVHNIMNTISDNSCISDDDKKALGIMKETGDIEDLDSISYTDNNSSYDPYLNLMDVIKTLISSSIVATTKGDLKINDQKTGILIFRLFQDINLDKMAIVNDKFGSYDINTFLGMVNIIKSKQGKGIVVDKNKNISKNILEINNSILKF